MARKYIDNPNACTLVHTMNIIGNKWKPIIIYQLSKSPKRFGQLDALINGISRKVLTSQLNELINDRLITRTRFPEVPPRVEYELTEKGKELLPVFASIADWGMYLVDEYKQEAGVK